MLNILHSSITKRTQMGIQQNTSTAKIDSSRFGSSMRFLGSGGGRMVECENLSPQQPPRTRSSKLIYYCENTLLNKSIAKNECTLKLYEAAETLDFALAAQGGQMVECENLSPQQPPRTRESDPYIGTYEVSVGSYIDL
ncbi:hypothetical protein Tco_0329164 [Tanacetum coccineum]